MSRLETGERLEQDGAASAAAVGGAVIEVELAQSLGLTEAVTIGVGTMIGAGIFVLPGFIITRAGPGAVLAFALGGVVALFCAMSAAEVATGMPKSGGGYYFISRALGPAWGAIIGWGSWFGLVFATAFYAVGFGEYLHQSVHQYVDVSVGGLAFGMTILLVLLNLVGAKVAGGAQNVIVAVLIVVMLLFVGVAAPAAEPALALSDPLPFGLAAVFAGTATLFVTYCGFGEVASMAEEIRDPGRNLPRALIGSVVSVTVLYCVVVGICVMLRPADQLGSSTIVADLAGDLMGPWGRGAILLGAVMATVSSANASIMSASRISFAMGRDNLVSDWLNKVHARFRVPHRAVIVTGALILLVILVGDIELLAEAAGLLHLLMYGLICVACIVLRGAKPMAYSPAYKAPFFPLIPLLGAVGTLVISFFIAPVIVLMGLGLVVFALLHYWFRGRKRTTVRGAWPHFLRRAVLEPALARVEGWGAHAEEAPTAIVAVREPARARPRLELATALMGPVRGRVIATHAYVVAAEAALGESVLAEYQRTIELRERELQETAASFGGGARVSSHVPLALSVTTALVGLTETSRAGLLVLGWPRPGPDHAARMTLLDGIARYVRTHVVVFRASGRLPPRSILVVLGAGEGPELALMLAARLSAAWGARLTAATLVPPDVAVGDAVLEEAALRGRIGDQVRAEFRAVRGESIAEAVRSAAPFWDLVVLGTPPSADGGLLDALVAIDDARPCSLLLVRPHESQSVDCWI